MPYALCAMQVSEVALRLTGFAVTLCAMRSALCSLRLLLVPLTPCASRLTVCFGGAYASDCIS